MPRFGLDPFGWLTAAERIAGEHKADLLFPAQEQVTVLSACHQHLRVATIVPPFSSLARAGAVGPHAVTPKAWDEILAGAE